MSTLAGRAVWAVGLVVLCAGLVLGLMFGSFIDDASAKKKKPCPDGTVLHEGACIETTGRGMSKHYEASLDCLDEDRRLPTVAELQTFHIVPGTGFSGYELTSQQDQTDSIDYVFIVNSVGYPARTPVGAIWWYRCVAPAS